MTQQTQHVSWIAALALFVMLAAPAYAVRVKDITSIEGVRENQLVGYGIVVGVDGTGDDAEFARQGLISFLRRHRIQVDPNDVETENLAAVMVVATLPPFARQRCTSIHKVMTPVTAAATLTRFKRNAGAANV